MARENELERWKQRLTVSHNKFVKTIEPKVKRAWEYYRGNQWNVGSEWDMNTPMYKEKVVDNVVFANLRTLIPKINFRNPKVFVRPKKKPFRVKNGMFDTIQASMFVELLANYYYKTLEIKREARKCLYDSFLAPWGVMQIGYTLSTEKAVDDEQIEINEIIKEDSPFVVRRDPKDFRVDPEAMDARLNDAAWIALRWVKSLEDLKRDKKNDNTHLLKANYRVKTDFPGSPQMNGYREEPRDEEEGLWGRVEGWDIWDRKRHRFMRLVENHNKFLINDDSWPLDIDGFPVETLYFNENAQDLFPVPDTWLYLDMQDELNRIGSMQLDHIRRISQRRYLSQDNAMSEEEERKLTHGGDGTIAHTNIKPEGAVIPLQDATISQDIYLIRQGLKKTIREMAGISDTELLASSKFEQATEPALIEQAAMGIRADQQSIFEDFIRRVVEKLMTVVQQTMEEIAVPLSAEQMNDDEVKKFTENKLAKIAGPEGAVMLLPWLEIEQNDIQGDYIYTIEIGSTTPVNEEKEKRDAVTLYQLMAQNPFIRQREGTREVLEAFKKPDPDRLLKPEQQVQQEQQAAAQAAVEREQAIDAPKRQVDLEKTKIKADVTHQGNLIKAHMASSVQNMKTEDSQRSTHAKLLTEALKLKAQKDKPKPKKED